jgi:hypothetical protein
MCWEKHTIAFDNRFFETVLPRYGLKVVSFSDPHNEVDFERLLAGETVGPIHEGDELIVSARRCRA